MGPIGLPANTRAVVGRAPVMAPGDLRLLKAADPRGLDAALLSMHNVIVFPRTGTESEPSKMGGGDLDGDCFFIIWDPDLVPKEEAPALNYSASGARPQCGTPSFLVSVTALPLCVSNVRSSWARAYLTAPPRLLPH